MSVSALVNPVIVHDPDYGDQEGNITFRFDDGAVEVACHIPGDSRSLVYTIAADRVPELVSPKYPLLGAQGNPESTTTLEETAR